MDRNESAAIVRVPLPAAAAGPLNVRVLDYAPGGACLELNADGPVRVSGIAEGFANPPVRGRGLPKARQARNPAGARAGWISPCRARGARQLC